MRDIASHNYINTLLVRLVTQRLRTDLGRSVGATTIMESVWSKGSTFPLPAKVIQMTHIYTLNKTPLYRDRWPTAIPGVDVMNILIHKINVGPVCNKYYISKILCDIRKSRMWSAKSVGETYFWNIHYDVLGNVTIFLILIQKYWDS